MLRLSVFFSINFFFNLEPLVSVKTVAAVGTGVAAVLAAPAILAGVGFTTAGVAAGSLAAMLQVTFIMLF